jgi:hypothetical protein
MESPVRDRGNSKAAEVKSIGIEPVRQYLLVVSDIDDLVADVFEVCSWLFFTTRMN